MEILFFVVVVAAVVATWYLFNKLKAPTKPEPKLCECVVPAPENFVDNPVVIEKEETAAKLDEEYLQKPKKKAKVVKKNG
jgi:hypothetical protein